MSVDLKLALIIAGALIVLAAVVSGIVRRATASSRATQVARVVVGLLGVALIVYAWVFLPGSAVSTANAPAEAVTTVNAVVPAPAATSAPAPAPEPTPAAPARVDLVVQADSAMAGCAMPMEPPTPPDGTRASRAQMLAAQKIVKAYDAAVVGYVACLDAASQQLLQQYQGVATAADLRAINALDLKVHNAAIDREKVLVDAFNLQLRTYKAQHATPSGPLPPAP